MKIPVEASQAEIELLTFCQPFTMTSVERLWAALSATKYVAKNNISGAFVECGVWRGGSSMAMMGTLTSLGIENRDFYLFDTFEGMTEATNLDNDPSGVNAQSLLEKTSKGDGNNIWCVADIQDVSTNIALTGYPVERVKLVKGDVLETLLSEENIPDQIAILRLDTDWYESTKIELEILFPRLVSGGVCIVDDYGHWSGARKAVDDYLEDNQLFPLINAPDYTGRVFIKN